MDEHEEAISSSAHERLAYKATSEKTREEQKQQHQENEQIGQQNGSER